MMLVYKRAKVQLQFSNKSLHQFELWLYRAVSYVKSSGKTCTHIVISTLTDLHNNHVFTFINVKILLQDYSFINSVKLTPVSLPQTCVKEKIQRACHRMPYAMGSSSRSSSSSSSSSSNSTCVVMHQKKKVPPIQKLKKPSSPKTASLQFTKIDTSSQIKKQKKPPVQLDQSSVVMALQKRHACPGNSQNIKQN